AGRDRRPRTRRRAGARRRGVLRRPRARQAVGARAHHHGLRPQPRAADRRKARVPGRQGRAQRAPVLYPRPGGRPGAAGARRARPLRHGARGGAAAGEGAGLMRASRGKVPVLPCRGGGIAAAIRARALVLRVVVLLAAAAIAATAAPAIAAQSEEGAVPRGEPQSAGKPRDADFGVTTRHPGLQRHVEMYQWTRAGSGYALEWRGARVDSSGFAPGHANPREIPLREREWREDVTLDGRPVPRDIVDALARWQPFRPNFSALPGNMAATFQPEGDGLGSAENPLDPQVGDLRITWRELVLPPLADRLVLRDGEWALREPAGTLPAMDAATATPGPGNAERRRLRWPFAIAPILAVLVVLVVVVRRRRGQRT